MSFIEKKNFEPLAFATGVLKWWSNLWILRRLELTSGFITAELNILIGRKFGLSTEMKQQKFALTRKKLQNKVMVKGYLKLYCKLTAFYQKIHCHWEGVKGIQKLFFLKNYSLFWRLECDMTLNSFILMFQSQIIPYSEILFRFV